MSVEHQPRPSDTHERAQAELEAMRQAKMEELSSSPEAAAEQAQQRAEQAREAIKQQDAEPEPANQSETAAPASPPMSLHLDQLLNYRNTLSSLQQRLSPASRAFSRVIHTPVVERTSEVLEGTIMRPSVIAGATWTAAIVGLIFYVVARYYGYPLSGSEMLAALLGGAVLGLIVEALGRLIRRR